MLILILWFAISRLIRRLVMAERLANQSDRLRALGTATAGIAHEIRNPLGIILLSTEELRATVKHVADEKQREAIEELTLGIRSETERLSKMTTQFLEFSRKDHDAGAANCIVADSIEQTLALFEKGKPSTIQVLHDLEIDRSAIVAIEDNRLRQVLLNLLNNSCEAFAGRAGNIRIRVREIRGNVEINVEDNGPGMDAATLSQAFDPFFTTRAQGTGLGLSLCRTLIEDRNGQLALRSEVGKGTTATITLPMAASNS
jgi:signal transduction histidine kinase